MHRVTSLTRAGARLAAEGFSGLAAQNVTVVLAGVKRGSREWDIIREWSGSLKNVRDFYLLDTAIEWAEDQLVYRYGGAVDFRETTELAEQPLLAGLSPEELAGLASIGTVRHYKAGEKIISAGNAATSLFFLRSGAVHVTLPDGVRLATLTAGMAFGEMALIEPDRSADVLADISASAVDVSLKDFERFRTQHPRAAERIMRNLAQLLADRLIVANTRVDLLSSG